MAETGQDSAICPLCNQKITTAIPDKQLERLLKEKLVYCLNKAYGCTWTGKLGQLEEGHLNATPPPDKLMDGCPYVELFCSQCQKMKVKRHAMENHMQKECPKRIALCTYCKKHRAAYEDIGRIHHPVCQYVPEPCPKGCGAKPLRKNIAKHVANWCPKTPQPCPFHIVGCTKKLSGSKMESHLRDRGVLKSHLSSVEKTVDALRREIGKKDTQIETLQKELKETVGALRKEVGEKDKQIKTLQTDLKTKEARVGALLSEIEKKDLDMGMPTKHKDKLISKLKEELVANEKCISSLQGQARSKEQELVALREEFDRMEKCMLRKPMTRKLLSKKKLLLLVLSWKKSETRRQL